jgi:hypothetical protein
MKKRAKTHLLAAVRLKAGSQLWTRDKRLGAIANRMGLSAEQSSSQAGVGQSAVPADRDHRRRAVGPDPK